MLAFFEKKGFKNISKYVFLYQGKIQKSRDFFKDFFLGKRELRKIFFSSISGCFFSKLQKSFFLR